MCFQSFRQARLPGFFIFTTMFLLFSSIPIFSQEPGITYGDANSDTSINIVDALVTAQYYVGLNPSPFNPDAVDVDGNGSVDIVDALLIAQYYVGLIDVFPVENATPTPTPPPSPGEMVLVGQLETGLGHRSSWIGQVIIGNYLYILPAFECLKIFNVQDSAQPQFVKDADITINCYSSEVDSYGRFIYYRDTETDTLGIIDASNPLYPSELPAFPLPSTPGDIKINGDYAYVACLSHLVILDLQNPSSPDIVTQTDAGSGDISIQGNYLYLTSGVAGDDFGVFDISNPVSPVLLDSIDTTYSANDMVVSGDYAYYIYFEHLTVVDISNPSSIFLVAEYDVPIYIGSTGDIEFSNGYLYVGHSTGLFSVDVTTPSSPSFAGEIIARRGFMYSLHLKDQYLYAQCSSHTSGSRLTIVDTSIPGSPSIVTIIDGYGSCLDVVVQDSYAYLADGYGGIKIVDISDPASPVLLSGAETGEYASHLDISGNHLYVSNIGVTGFDVSNPLQPVNNGTIDTHVRAQEITASGNYVYVADWPWALTVLDGTNPDAVSVAYHMEPDPTNTPTATPDPNATTTPGGTAESSPPPPTPTPIPHPNYWLSKSISIENNYAYLCVDREPIVRIVNISSPTQPVETSTYNGMHDAEDIFVSGDYAYITSLDDYNLQILNISNPSSPVLTGTLRRTEGEALEVFVSGNYAYLLINDDIDSILKVDVSNPSSPVIEQELLLGARDSFNLFVKDNYLYVANGYDSSMLLIYRIE